MYKRQLLSHRKSGRLREVFGIYESYVNDDDFEISFEELKPDNDYETIIDTNEGKDSIEDNKISDRLRAAFEFKYDLKLSELNSKLSVSDVAKNDDSVNFILSRPAFMTESGKLTAAEKGTALHRFLQFTDFKNLEDVYKRQVRYEDVQNEINSRKVNIYLLGEGAGIFIKGLAKKVLLANNIGLLWTEIKGIDVYKRQDLSMTLKSLKFLLTVNQLTVFQKDRRLL